MHLLRLGRESDQQSGAAFNLILTPRKVAQALGQIGGGGYRLLIGILDVALQRDAILIGILHVGLMLHQPRQHIVVENQIAGRRKINHCGDRDQQKHDNGGKARDRQSAGMGAIGKCEKETVMMAVRPVASLSMTGVHQQISQPDFE